MTSDEREISVNAPATRPPVQDSAVAMVSLRIRQRSSSERERARASLPLILIDPTFVAPREANGGARGGGDAFFAAGEAEPLASGRFHGHARDVQPGDLSDPLTHGIAQRSDLRPFADQRHLESGDPPAAPGDAAHRVFQETVRPTPLPSPIRARELRTATALPH